MDPHAAELELLRSALASHNLDPVISMVSSAEQPAAVVAAAAQTLRRMVHNRRPEIGEKGGVAFGNLLQTACKLKELNLGCVPSLQCGT